jgi:parallel beta-helix repeat protein
VSIHDVTVRRGQNGIMLDRVNDSKVYDNDCSFLSGWGLSMWRSSRNTISRNALDFCVRGHSEGVYNRGQDSAGILCYEQCSGNAFSQNSVTHGGDGFFGFAGKEAIGQKEPLEEPVNYADPGCNDNIIIGNDFSYAPAHGLEMTFSGRNVIAENLFIEDAICGVWAGYSRDTLIARNTFARTGGLGYGLERGGVNIEHGSGNRVLENTFDNNRAAFCIWWDQDEPALENLPGVKTPYTGVSGNVFAGNTVQADDKTMHETFARPAEPPVGFELRDSSGGQKSKFGDNYEGLNTFNFPSTGIRISAPGGAAGVHHRLPTYLVPVCNTGHTSAVDCPRRSPAAHIIWTMGPLGPRFADGAPSAGRAGRRLRSPRHIRQPYAGNLLPEKENRPAIPTALEPLKLTIAGDGGYTEYAYRLVDGDWSKELRGSIVQAQWTTTFFKNATDPRTDEPGWRAAATGPDAVTVTLPAIDLPFGYNGPARTVRLLDPEASKPLADAKFKANQFGLVASTTIHLPAGQWKLVVESDDGVRLRADGKTVIENWTLHGPARDEAVLAD